MAVNNPDNSPISPERRAAVAKARDDWISKLIDLSRNNRLLYFRDLKTGTIDLSDSDPDTLRRFLCGEAVSLIRLLPHANEKATQARAQGIRRSALANLEEKGLETLFVAFGFASWPASDGGRPPDAPVLLVPVGFESRGRLSKTSNLKIRGEAQVNPILLYVLEKELGRKLNADALLGTSGGADDDNEVDPHAVYGRLGSALCGLAGFRILPRVVLGNFAFQKMAMVRDLQENGDLLEQHAVVSAIAGDNDAKDAVRATQESVEAAELDSVPPGDEFLVLDADSSQQAAIRAILKDQTALVIGPPGTGKSQTIANLIAELSARGRRILFVAEKRVALEVVLERLRLVGLGHFALDLHGAGITRKEVMKQFSESLDLVRNSLPVEDPASHESLVDRRTRLNQHASRLHSPRLPCGLSAFDIMGRLLRASSNERSRVRWRGTELDCISKDVAQKIRNLLIELGGFSGLLWGTDRSPWVGSTISDGVAAQEAVDAVTRLQGILPALRSSVAAVSTEAQMHEPKTLEQLTEVLDVLGQIGSSINVLGSKIFDEDLESLTRTLAHGRNLASHLLAWCFSKRYRKAYGTVAALYTGERRTSRQLYQNLSTALAVKKRWSSLVPGAQVPIACPSVPRCQKESAAAQTAIRKLASLLGRHDLSRLTLQELGDWIARLASDLLTPYRLVRFLEIERDLVQLGTGPIIAEIREQQPPAEVWPKLFDYAWLASSFDQALAQDAGLAGFNGWAHGQFVQEFCALDTQRLVSTAARARRAHAEWATGVMNAHSDQSDLVRREANKKARHLPLRKLLELAPDVLTALRPCWLASPLSVSELIPAARRYFDIVLFDEASQVLPEDAVPALLRAPTAVVAGDQYQLPPTKFFTVDDEIEDEADPSAATSGFESLLDQLLSFLNPCFLQWHYRSKDEALIAFSNHHIYSDRLVTFPGTGGPPSISHVLVPSAEGQDGQEESSSVEVRRVVQLVLKHAAERPDESLGVIAMGVKHAHRIQAALDYARDSRPDLDAFFDETRKERFFVKNLERVQGDERDAIILTIGYGKDRSGRLLYRFGPLLSQGGERRLNVAITRARRRMVLVSSFDHHDMDPNRSRARGVELLRSYIEYAASHGRLMGEKGQLDFPPNAFEADVYDALKAKGLSLIPQFGVSKYRIDLVAQHPQRPGRFVLAIECDGASYHSAPTARDRDRLRQQHLEALGYRFHRIWSTDWFMRRDDEIAHAVDAFRKAVEYADRLDSAASRDDTRNVGTNGTQQARPVAQPISQRGPKPDIPRKASIADYTVGELMAWAKWVESDGRLRTDDEIVDEVTRLLFQRKGSRIEARIREAIARLRRRSTRVPHESAQ